MVMIARERHMKQSTGLEVCDSHAVHRNVLPSAQSCFKTRFSSRRKRERFPILSHLLVFQSRTGKV